jgi:large subunit ribosomal protein L23
MSEKTAAKAPDAKASKTAKAGKAPAKAAPKVAHGDAKMARNEARKAPVAVKLPTTRQMAITAARAAAPQQGVPQAEPTNATRRAANTQGHLRRSGRGSFAPSPTANVDPFSVILHPMVTEKSMGQMDRDNSLEFLVRRSSDKHQIKQAVERLFDCTVSKVNTRISREGKRATVRFGGDSSAEDIGQRIGVF